MNENPFKGLDFNNPEDVIKAAKVAGITRYELRKMSPMVNDYLSKGTAQIEQQEDQPGVASDLWSSFGVGAGNLVKAAGSLYGLATGDMDNGATRLGNTVTDYWQKEKSNVLKELEQGRKDAINNSDSEIGRFGNAIWETLSNGRLLASFVSEQIPMFAVPGGAGAAGAKAGAAYAAKKGTQVAAQKFGAKVGTGVGVGVGATMQGGDVGANTYEELLNLPEPIWEKNAEYLQLKDLLGNADEAKEKIALSYGRKASAIAGALSVGTQFIPGGRTIEKTMAGNKLTGGLMGRAGKGFLGEGGQEILEEGGGKLISNSFVNNIDESRGTFEGVGEASGLALIGGGVVGGGLAAISGQQDIEGAKRQYENQLSSLRAAGKQAVARGDLESASQIDKQFKETQANYDDYLKFYDPNFVETNFKQQEEAKAKVAEQGGDALDQANAASNVASNIAEDVTKEVDAKVQKQREEQARTNPMQTWQPNFTMPGSEQEQAQQVDGEYIANTDYPTSVPLGNNLGFDPSVGAINANPENRVNQSETIFTGEQREELPAPERLGLPDRYTNTIQGQDRTSELDAQEQMRRNQNAPRQIEQKDIVFGEDNRFRVGTERATVRSNGNPFPTLKSVQASRSYRNAIEQGINPEIVKVGNGLGWETNEDIDAPQVETQAPMVEETVQEVEQEQSGQPTKPLNVNALNETVKKGLLSRIKYLKSEESLDSALQQAVAEGADSESIQEIQTAVDLRKAQLRGDNNPQPATTSLLDTGRTGQSERPSKAITPQGREVGVEYRVVDASEVINSNDENGIANPDFPQEYQNRNRSRSASTQQIRNIANKLNPEQVDYGNMSTDGAPIVSPDGIVESGNGRVAGIKLAYKQGKANQYREYLEQQGYDTEGLREPVLVRVRTTDMTPEERRQFVTESNERTTLSLSATEKAKDDANIISRIATDFMGGDVDNVANAGFVRKFMQGVSSTEAAELTDAEGRLSQTGKRRIEAALLFNAYGDERVVTDLFESSDNDIKSIGGAMLDNAGQWAKMRQQAPTELDLTNNVVEAVNLVKQARREGRSVQELVGQQDIFSGEIPLETDRALRMMYGKDLKRAVSRKALSEKLSQYATLASNVNPEPGLFGDEVDSVSSNDLMDQINGTENTTNDIQETLFNVEDNSGRREEGERPSGNDTFTKDNQSVSQPEPTEVSEADSLIREALNTGRLGLGARVQVEKYLENKGDMDVDRIFRRIQMEGSLPQELHKRIEKIRKPINEQPPEGGFFTPEESELATEKPPKVIQSGVEIELPVVSKETESQFNMATHTGRGRDFNKELKDSAEFILTDLEERGLLDTPERKEKAKELIQDYLEDTKSYIGRESNRAANNPSWMITGRGNLDLGKYNKKAESYARSGAQEAERLDTKRKSIISKVRMVMNDDQRKAEAEKRVAKEKEKSVTDFAGELGAMLTPGMTKSAFMPRAKKAWDRIVESHKGEIQSVVDKIESSLSKNNETLKGVLGARSNLWKEIESAISQEQNQNTIESENPTQTEPNQIEESQQDKPSLSTLNPVERYDALWDRANEGDTSLTTEDLKGSYQALLQNAESVKAELNGLTKKQLLKYYNGFHDSGMKKQELVDSAYDDMLKSYRFLGTTDDFVSSTISFGAKGIERYDNVTRELDNLTDEKLREVITTRKAKSDERSAEMKARVDGMKNPETLEDFRNATRYGLSKDFTNEQWAKYDRLVADEQMERQKKQAERQVQAFNGEVNYNLHETTHSKKGHDLFVVEMVERLPSDKYKELNQKAKALGGYYSSYRRDGAIPGFQFPSEEARTEFVQVMSGESVTKTKQSKDKTDSLLGLAERIEEKANDELNRDRKTNTSKRAGEAASAIESAENNLVRAKKLKALANAIKNGETKYLNKVTAGTDQELLESLWNQIWYRARNNDDYTEDAGQGRWQRERKWKEGTTDEDKVRLAEYPLTNMYPGMVKRVAKEMIDTKGYTLAGKSLLKLAESAGGDTKQVNVLANKHHEKMMEFLRKNAETEYGREVAKDYMRIKRMGLNSLPTLRAALLEYKSITDNVGEVNTNSAVKEKLKYEEIRGQYKDLDFFNSTDVVANEAMNYLELEEGMSVLEPSAGVGHLADAAAAVVGKENVTTNEFAFGLNEFLKEKGYQGTQGDFLALEPEPKHDRVLMNPPFSKDQEIKHIEHAYKFLKPGGRLVAVTSSMAGNRSNKTNVAFKEWMDEVGAFEVPLPEGAFKDAINPTNVNAKIIVIDKPEGETNDLDSVKFNKIEGSNKKVGVPLETAQRVHDEFIKKYKGLDDGYQAIITDKKPSDIFGPKAADLDGSVKGGYDTRTNRGYYFTETHNSEADLKRTINEELLVHKGLGIYSQEEITNLLDTIGTTRKSQNPRLVKIWENVDKNYDGKSEIVKAEEFLGKVSHEKLTTPDKYFNRVVSAFQSILQKLGLVSDKITFQQMRNEVYKIAEALEKGAPARRESNSDVKLNRDSTPRATAPVEKRWSKDWFKRKLQDKFAPIADMQASIEKVNGQELPEDQNTYRAEELFYGKTENDLVKMEENHVKPLVDAMTQNNIESGELDQYLMAKHARERNAYIASINFEMPDGGSGMTNAEADEILSRYADEGKLAGLSIAAEEVYKITKKRRDLLRESGLEDDSLIDVWDANYQFYVPLKGFAEDSEGKTIAKTGSGFDIRGKESMKAMGRRTMAESPTAHAIQDLSATIIRARKNEVGKTFLNMVEANPNPDIWEVFTDENPDTERRIVNGEVKENQPIDMRSRKDDYFSVKIDGKSKYIKLKDKDGLLMEAMKNMGPSQMNTFTKSMSAVTRWLSMVNTSLNPEFAITNAFRDIQTAGFNALAEQDLDDGKVKGKEIVKKMTLGAPKSFRALLKHSRGELDSNDPMYKHIEDFLSDGAKTGYFDSKDVEQIGKDMASLLDITKGTNKGKLLKAKNKIGDFVESINGSIENAVRLSAYIEAVDAGVTREKAASFAKNLSVNFNRRGSWGATLNSLYMFFNAAIQGNANFARAILTPKEGGFSSIEDMKNLKLNTAQRVAAGITAASFAWAAGMREWGGEDEDGVPYWDKIPKGVRERNLVIPSILWGGEPGDYVKIPLPYGYNIFYNLGDAAEAAFNSDTRKAGDLAGEMALSVYASFIPLGSPVGDNAAESALLAGAPTITKPIVELVANKNFFGGPIYRENDPYGAELRDSQMSMKSTAQIYKNISQFMNDVIGDGRNYKVDGDDNPWYDISPDSIEHIVEFSLGGLYRFGSRVADNANTLANGGDLSVTEAPFIRQLNGEIRPYADISQFYDARQQLKNIEAEFKSLRGKERLEFRKEYNDKFRLKGLMSSLDKRMKLLRKQRDRVETDDSLSFVEREEKLERIEERMKTTAAQFNRRWNEVD